MRREQSSQVNETKHTEHVAANTILFAPTSPNFSYKSTLNQNLSLFQFFRNIFGE